MTPPAATAATTAADVQLAGVPSPIMRVGCDVSTAAASGGTAAWPFGLPVAGCGAAGGALLAAVLAAADGAADADGTGDGPAAAAVRRGAWPQAVPAIPTASARTAWGTTVRRVNRIRRC